MFTLEIRDTAGNVRVGTLAELLNPAGTQKMLEAGQRYAGRGFKRELAKHTKTYLSLPSARIKQEIADPQINYTTGVTKVVIERQPITATTYGFRDRGRGLRGAWYRGQSTTVDRSFVKKSGKGAGLGFFRVSETSRNPIWPVKGPSVGSAILGQSDFGEEIVERSLQYWAEQFSKGMERELKRKSRGF